MEDIKFSSGNKIVWKDGRPVYHPGQIRLGGVLGDLPPHFLDRDKKTWIVPLMEALDLIPDAVLEVVADEIESRANSPLAKLPPVPGTKILQCRPRLPEIKELCTKAMQMDAALAGLLLRRRNVKKKPRPILLRRCKES